MLEDSSDSDVGRDLKAMNRHEWEGVRIGTKTNSRRRRKRCRPKQNSSTLNTVEMTGKLEKDAPNSEERGTTYKWPSLNSPPLSPLRSSTPQVPNQWQTPSDRGLVTDTDISDYETTPSSHSQVTNQILNNTASFMNFLSHQCQEKDKIIEELQRKNQKLQSQLERTIQKVRSQQEKGKVPSVRVVDSESGFFNHGPAVTTGETPQREKLKERKELREEGEQHRELKKIRSELRGLTARSEMSVKENEELLKDLRTAASHVVRMSKSLESEQQQSATSTPMPTWNESQLSLDKILTLGEGETSHTDTDTPTSPQTKPLTLALPDIHNQLKNVAWPKCNASQTHRTFADRCKKMTDLYLKEGIPDHDLALSLSKHVMQSSLHDAYIANLDSSKMLSLETVLNAIRDCDLTTKNLNPFEKFKLVELEPKEGFERFINRTRTSLRELQLVPLNNPKLALRMIKEQFIDGARIPLWIANHLEPLEDLDEIASVAENLMRNNGMADWNYRHKEQSMHTLAPSVEKSGAGGCKSQAQNVQHHDFSGLSSHLQEGQSNMANTDSRFDGTASLDLAPQNRYQHYGKRIKHKPNFRPYGKARNQQAQYDTPWRSQPRANWSSNPYPSQALTTERHNTGYEPIAPQSPSFGPYNGAWQGQT